jgi:glucose/arabinose dehydrogenase
MAKFRLAAARRRNSEQYAKLVIPYAATPPQLGMVFNSATRSFPQEYHNGIVTMHGSWNRAKPRATALCADELT